MIELTREERCRVWLYDVLQGSAANMAALLEQYESAQTLFDTAARGVRIRLENRKDAAFDKLCATAKEAHIDALLERYEKLQLQPVSLVSENYPKLLREIYDPPQILFVKGTLPEDIPLPLAVIGARKCSAYGRDIARKFGRELADAGCCVISGLAYGVDAAAARGALESGGDYPTIAVLGCGADVIYPKSSAKDYAQIVRRGAVVSEYLPGTPPLRANFPQRNRIISGISRGTLVVEAGARSGTSITVNYALDQGRDVFAVPGRITDEQSEGTNRAIRDGYAKAALCTEDILCEYGRHARGSDAQKVDYSKLPEEQRRIAALLADGEKNFDELCDITAISPPQLNSILTVMEFSGIIRQMSGRMYTL